MAILGGAIEMLDFSTNVKISLLEAERRARRKEQEEEKSKKKY